MNWQKFGKVGLSALLAACFVATIAPAAPFYSDSNLTPSPDGVYRSTSSIDVPGVGTIPAGAFQFSHAVGGVAPPPPGGSVVGSFNVLVELDLGALGSFSGPGVGALRMEGNGPDTSDSRTFDTEMLQLNISGGTFPPGVMIRESPTRASMGKTMHRDTPSYPTGQYQIDSFFDIFTETSFDGGQTWLPASGSVRVESVEAIPEPSSIALATVGAVAFGWHRLRRRRSRV